MGYCEGVLERGNGKSKEKGERRQTRDKGSGVCKVIRNEKDLKSNGGERKEDYVKNK